MVLQLEPDICMHRKPLQHYQGWGSITFEINQITITCLKPSIELTLPLQGFSNKSN